MVRSVVWTLLVVLLAGLLFVLVLALLEPAMIYYPAPAEGVTPTRWNLPYEDVRIPTEDGETLHAWWLPRPEPQAPVLLFFHGNAGNREGRLHNLAGLWQAGISVLIFDYRGYGGSTGRPTERGLLRDGLAAADWLATRLPQRPVFYFGRSLGGAVAARTALTRPPAGLILESTFLSVPAMASRAFPLPGIRYLVRTRLDALDAVRQLHLPLLVIHGTADELVPFTMGQTLYDASPSGLKTFKPVRGGTHNDTYVVAGNAYWDWLHTFLAGASEAH